MILVNSYQELLENIAYIRYIGKGFITNFYPDVNKHNLWIKNKYLYVIKEKETILFFYKRDSHIAIYYVSSALNELLEALKKIDNESIFVIDVISDSENSDILSILKESNFKHYTTLRRMSKIKNEVAFLYQKNDNIQNAQKDDFITIQNILNEYFDKYAEQLPIEEEINRWIDKSNIILYKQENNIAGILIYDIIGYTLYLRYWLVLSQYRNLKIGSELLKEFLYRGKDTKRQLFWVKENNENAIKRYMHFGFKLENMYDFIWIKNKLI
ncbi:MAG: GNAT family N-acetyltransferase [Bacteroidales bacterium]